MPATPVRECDRELEDEEEDRQPLSAGESIRIFDE